MRPPELSIIVPVLHEAAILPDLFRTLAEQEHIDFELILVDAGSGDGTLAQAQRLARENSFLCRIVVSDPGRGRQMNAGAAVARGDFLLFLHADSQFGDPLALRNGLTAMQARVNDRGDERVAGRFSLRFRRADRQPSLPYYFYECKARLDRLGCLHGDQGFLLLRSFFAVIGPFDESLPILEDDRLAVKVHAAGEWLLLTGEISTSSRRFETEGLWQRQTLNALILNFAAIGWDDFLNEVRDLYRRQCQTSRLHLYPFFAAVAERMSQLSWRRRLQLWYRTGAFVRDNAWQLALVCDARRNFRSRLPVGQGGTPTLEIYDRHLDALTNHPPGRFLAAGLTWCWFQATRVGMRCRGLSHRRKV